jgi:DNA-binding response OmpR family regulator
MSEMKTRPAVLLVEDEAVIRELLAIEFEDAGFQVHDAASADEAILLLGALSVGIVVTDLRMPGTLDGTGLIQWLRRHRPNLPIIVTSGHAAVAELGDLGVPRDLVVSKPYRPVEVVALVGGLLERAL